jgi:hypothetical protein
VKRLDIEVRSEPGPAKSTLEAAARRLGYRVSQSGDAGPRAGLLLIDARGGASPSGAALSRDLRPTLIVAEFADEDLCDSVRAHEHIIAIINPRASDAALRVGLASCEIIGGRQVAAA